MIFSRNRIFIAIFILALCLRLYHLQSAQLFFTDVAWYYDQARSALITPGFPISGIPASITWLHQGVLWTYLLIPALALSAFHPVSGSLLIVVFSQVTLILLYLLATRLFSRSSALIVSTLYAVFYLAIIHSRLAYHTSPVPLLFLTTLGLLIFRRDFFAGLFLGLLYQSHLLTFMFWPGVLIYTFKLRLSPIRLLAGFILGLFPLLLTGPLQIGGIFLWLLKQLLTFSFTAGLFSQSYFVVLFTPLLLAIAFLFKGFPAKYSIFLSLILIVVNLSVLFSASFFENRFPFGLTMADRFSLVSRINPYYLPQTLNITLIGQDQDLANSGLNYRYLYWWKNRNLPHNLPAPAQVVIDEPHLNVRVLE